MLEFGVSDLRAGPGGRRGPCARLFVSVAKDSECPSSGRVRTALPYNAGFTLGIASAPAHWAHRT